MEERVQIDAPEELVHAEPHRAWQILRERGVSFTLSADTLHVSLSDVGRSFAALPSHQQYLDLTQLVDAFLQVLAPLQRSDMARELAEKYARLGYDLEVIEYQGGGRWLLQPRDRRQDEEFEQGSIGLVVKGYD